MSLSSLSAEAFSVVVLTDLPVSEAEVINSVLRSQGVTTVYCRVLGGCGVVFSDFLNSVQDLNPLGTEEPEVRESGPL